MSFTVGTATFTQGSSTVSNVALTSGSLSGFNEGTRVVVGVDPVIKEIEAIDALTVDSFKLRSTWNLATGSYPFLANMTTEGLWSAVDYTRQFATQIEEANQFILSIGNIFNSVADGLAGTASTDFFSVSDSDPDTFATLYRNDQGVATQISQLPSLAIMQAAVDAANQAQTSAASADQDATTATQSKDTAVAAANTATTSKDTAVAAANSADSSATAANNSAVAADQSELNAGTFRDETLVFRNDAEVFKNTAESYASYKGRWIDLTGALNIPASVEHTGTMWQLLNNLADVTLSEPSGTNTDWLAIGATVTTVNGKAGAVVLNTDDINEGSTNLYFTAARALAAVNGKLFTVAEPENSGNPTTKNYVDQQLQKVKVLALAGI